MDAQPLQRSMKKKTMILPALIYSATGILITTAVHSDKSLIPWGQVFTSSMPAMN
jgi:hypothetical protein